MHAFNKALIDIYETAQFCSLPDFNKHGLGELKKLVAFDSCVLADIEIAAGGQMGVQTLYLESTPIERFQDRVQVIGEEALQQNGALRSQDDALVRAFRRRGQSVVTDISATCDDPQLLSYCLKYETAHSLAFVSGRTLGRSLPVLALWRANRKNSYTDQHVVNANVFIPHMLQAREINRRLKPDVAALPASRARLLSSLSGQVYFIDDDTIELLQTEWKEWTPPFLPTALMSALGSTSAKVFMGRRIAIQAEVMNGMLCLNISKKKNETACLTSAELRVATLAAQGMQYKEIAKTIDIAPATVRNQLHAVYRKLGVSNKTALAALMAVPT